MKSVWKFHIFDWWHGPFSLQSEAAVTKIVHAEVQDGDLFVWAEVLQDVPASTLPRLTIHGTGHSAQPGENHILTIRDGRSMWHLYGCPE